MTHADQIRERTENVLKASRLYQQEAVEKTYRKAIVELPETYEKTWLPYISAAVDHGVRETVFCIGPTRGIDSTAQAAHGPLFLKSLGYEAESFEHHEDGYVNFWMRIRW